MLLNPYLIWALPIGLIPIIIYYLMRFRSLRVAWGADYVLQLALEQLRKKLYLDQLILLALRVLACLAVVMAFARPAAKLAADRISGTAIHRLVIVDASYSMQAYRDNNALWQTQREIAEQLLASWGRGERWSLIAAGATPDWLVTDELIETAEAAAARLADLKCREVAANLPLAIAQAIEAAQPGPAEIYIFADDQATSWQQAHDLPEPPAGVRIFWVRPGDSPPNNLGVTEVRVRPERVLSGHPCDVTVKIRNFGADPATDVRLELLLDGAHRDSKTSALLAGQELTLRFQLRLELAGAHALTARLTSDGLDYDNQMSAGLEVVPALQLMVWQRPEPLDKFVSAGGFLELAAKAMASAEGGFKGAAIAVRIHRQTAPPAIDDVDVLVVDAGTPLNEAAADWLKAYVAGGGALLLAPDQTVDPTVWNRLLGPRELLPAPLLRAQSRTLGGEDFQTVTGTGLRYYGWVEFGTPRDDAETLTAFADGSAMGILARRQPGGVLLLAGGLNGQYNNLLVQPEFYALLMRLTAESLASRYFPRTLSTHQPMRLQLANADAVRGVTVGLEGEPTTVLPPAPVIVLPQGLPRTGLASALIVGEQSQGRVWFGIQGERVDSDLTPLSPAAGELLTTQLRLEVAHDAEELRELVQRDRVGREWQAWLFAAMLLFLVAELAMELRFV